MKAKKSSVRGFILLEFLVAVFLFSIVAVVLYGSLTQGLKAARHIQESYSASTPLRLFSFDMDKALRNTANLKDFPFQGKKDEITFPELKTIDTKEGPEKKLFLIRYFLKDHKIMRSEKEIKTGISRIREVEKTMAKGVKSLRFSFPYRDSDEKLSFESLWEQDPYEGIPRSVKVEIKTQKLEIEKIVSIPQGQFGYLKDGHTVAS